MDGGAFFFIIAPEKWGERGSGTESWIKEDRADCLLPIDWDYSLNYII